MVRVVNEHRQGSNSVTNTPLIAAELVDEREREEEIRRRILSQAIQANEVTNVDDDNDGEHKNNFNNISHRRISLLATILIIGAIVGIVLGIVLPTETPSLTSTVPPDPDPTPIPSQTPPSVTPKTTALTTTPT